MEPTVITQALLAWYDRHRRDLPWRAKPGQTADPYGVWLSEIMLQQTVVKTVAGAAGQVALALDRCGWPEIVGTVSGDDTIFIATRTGGDQRRLVAKLRARLEKPA